MKTLRARFDKKWAGEPNSGCWLWMAGGHGHFGYGGIYDGHRTEPAHRVSWELHRGAIPAGADVLHRCDVACCVNPAHLYLGSQIENNLDRDRRGRQVAPVGEANGNARLTDDLVRAIRSASGKQRDIAKRFDVCQRTVSLVKRHLTWSHVA